MSFKPKVPISSQHFFRWHRFFSDFFEVKQVNQGVSEPKPNVPFFFFGFDFHCVNLAESAWDASYPCAQTSKVSTFTPCYYGLMCVPWSHSICGVVSRHLTHNALPVYRRAHTRPLPPSQHFFFLHIFHSRDFMS